MVNELGNGDVGGNQDGESQHSSTEEDANESSSDDVAEGMCSDNIKSPHSPQNCCGHLHTYALKLFTVSILFN
jgi:hypothetical protein